MALTIRGIIEIPDSANTSFDHGAFDPKSRRVFVAHTARDCLVAPDRLYVISPSHGGILELAGA